MRIVAAPILAAALSAVALPAATAAPVEGAPALTLTASRLSGLPVKRPVPVRIVSKDALQRLARRTLDREYPVARQAYDQRLYRALGLLPPTASLRRILVDVHVRGVRALYDPRTRVVYARRGAPRRTVVSELVRALQDQSFDLRRTAGLRRRDRDRALAAGAVFDGAAALGVGPTRTVASKHGSRARTFVALESTFLAEGGLRLTATLDEVGGPGVVRDALRRVPRTTEQLLHVDKLLRREQPKPVALPAEAAGFSLRGADTFGEVDVRAFLATHGATGLDRAAEGWGGGRSAVYSGPGLTAAAIVLAWDEATDADEWAQAVAAVTSELAEGRSVAFARRGTRTALVVAGSEDDAARLAAALV